MMETEVLLLRDCLLAHGRLRLPDPAAHMPGTGHRRGDPGRAAAERAEAGCDAGERADDLGGAAAGFRLSPVSLTIAIRARVCSRSPLCITHTPGHMIRTDLRNAALAVL
jgi:hypothetical protein